MTQTPTTKDRVKAALLLRQERVQKRLPVPTHIPTEPAEIRATCAYWYQSKNPWFDVVRQGVNSFIDNVRAALREKGLEDPEFHALVKDAVVYGFAALRRRVEELSFVHHFAGKRGPVYGAPYLMKCLEELSVLNAGVEHFSTAAYRLESDDSLALQMDKLVNSISKKLNKPIAGIALQIYQAEVSGYSNMFLAGQRSFEIFKRRIPEIRARLARKKAAQAAITPVAIVATTGIEEGSQI
jgi:hypothetical protein